MIKYAPITEKNLLPLDEFSKKRADLRRHIIAVKNRRRVAIGPDVTFYFENRETLVWQIQEMLYIEKGGAEQIKDELRAYNPMVPKGHELVATMMIEIDDMERRRLTLQQLGHIENYVSFDIDGDIIRVKPEEDVERTDNSGKTSAVHFFHFPMTRDQCPRFSQAASVILQITHPRYTYKATITGDVLAALKEDL
ncbi:MAG: DUF3501 family protein [Alphaproteobacteria bacterium]|nr:DUF3501 family protein [Alphaproteobacteria bacterium]